MIGLGNIAYHFVKSFYNLDNVKLIAVASKSKEKLLGFKENFEIKNKNGEVAEWLKAHAWKACKGFSLSWVRIPFSPPNLIFLKKLFSIINKC